MVSLIFILEKAIIIKTYIMTVSCHNFYSKGQSCTQPREHEMCHTAQILPSFLWFQMLLCQLLLVPFIGVLVLVAVVGVVIWWVLRRRNFRKGDNRILRMSLMNLSTSEFYKSKVSFCLQALVQAK